MIKYMVYWSVLWIVWTKEGSEVDIAATILAGLTVLSVPFLWWFGSKARASREQEIANIKTLVEERSHMLEERSRGLSELHSRLDALNKQGSHGESMASEEGAIGEKLKPLALHETTKLLKSSAKRKGSSREIEEMVSALYTNALYTSPATAKLYHFYCPEMWPAYEDVAEGRVYHFYLPAVFSAYKALTGRGAAVEECIAAPETKRSESWPPCYSRWVEESTTDPEWLEDVDLHEPTGIEDLRRKSGRRRRGQRPLASLSY